MAQNLLRFVTCGSVDDGKSTLIGRLLYDSKYILRDHFVRAEKDSKKYGTQGDQLDFALLIDGLQAEREQGITIDVAYRSFSTKNRSFIIIDTPGHEQYTRNMATGASNADVAVVLVNAKKGILPQTRRHTTILSLLGVQNIILAINKMDLVNWDEKIFNTIVKVYKEFTGKLDIKEIIPIPLSAITGENVAKKSTSMSWNNGPTLLSLLESIDVPNNNEKSFRMPVQYINRPNSDFRGFSGMVVSGSVKVGDSILVCDSNQSSTVKEIIGSGKTGQSITLVLSHEIDISRGDIISSRDNPPDFNNQFACYLVWMSQLEMLPKRPYLLKIGTNTQEAQITDIKYKINIDNLDKVDTKNLKLNDIAYCNIILNKKIFFEPYKKLKKMGGFILIDKYSYETVAFGMINFGLFRGQNLTPHKFTIDKSARSSLKKQRPFVLWLTGLSGSGKSTTANALEKHFYSLGLHSYILDGDNLRHGLNKDIGFTKSERVENVRRTAEVARLFVDAGLIVIVSLISPFKNERRMAREMMEEGEFFEIFVDCSLKICEQRDPKGLYKKAREGKIKNFTGIDSAYQPPSKPEITVKTDKTSVNKIVEQIIKYLNEKDII